MCMLVNTLAFLCLGITSSSHWQHSNILMFVVGQMCCMAWPEPLGGSDSRLPCKRMPMGLLEHIVNFFNADSLQEISACPPDYKAWLATMYTHFGNKWASLHYGPTWSFISTEQGTASHRSRQSWSPTDAQVNIPALSGRTIRKLIAESPISIGAHIQEHVLDEAAKQHGDVWWWVKGDACDLVPGLCESVRLEWSGDIDLNDGALQKSHTAYIKRLEEVQEMVLMKSVDQSSTGMQIPHLDTCRKSLDSDIHFLHSGLQKAQAAYEEKQKSGHRPEKTLFNLAWKVKELEDLLQMGRELAVSLSVICDKIDDSTCDLVKENVALQLTSLQMKLTEFVKKLSRHQREAATHVFVFMISTEARNRKPYALPVQCFPCAGMKHNQLRHMLNNIVAEMVKRGMKVAGFATNGEFNSLRWKGNTRPLSILQIWSQSRSKFANRGIKAMLDMLLPVVQPDGSITTKLKNPAVPESLQRQIHNWMKEGASATDVIVRLRQQTVPEGYSPHTWIPGKTENDRECLCSILAQLEYRYQINDWDAKGVPFRSRAYVPEIHPVTKMVFHEREDEGHVFKRIAQSMRAGGPSDMQVERFIEAVHDRNTQLSYHALAGTRKQSVSDVEQIFSSSVISFMESNGYTFEAKYLSVVRNWRRACDERGLSQDQRSQYNREFLDFILEELMPWYSKPGMKDFLLLEVNQPINNIRGFTRETLSALLANIESREFRGMFAIEHGIPHEHPRAFTTDDVECFFSVLRDMVGKDFTHKQVMFGWRKVCEEFVKRMDPDLPFYYYTSSYQRFYEGYMPDFTVPVAKPREEPRPARRELLGGNVGGRVSMIQRGAGSIRTTFHNVPVELPPPPGLPTQHVLEHAYSFSH